MSIRYNISKLIQKNDNHICLLCGKTGKIFYWLRVSRKTIKLITMVRHKSSDNLCYESCQDIFNSMLKLKCVTSTCNLSFNSIKDLKIHLDKDHRI